MIEIEAIWSDNPEDNEAMKYLKTININPFFISEAYTTEIGEKVLVMSSGNEYLVKNFDFLKALEN